MVNLAQELYNCLWIEGQHNLFLHIINPKKNLIRNEIQPRIGKTIG